MSDEPEEFPCPLCTRPSLSPAGHLRSDGCWMCPTVEYAVSPPRCGYAPKALGYGPCIRKMNHSGQCAHEFNGDDFHETLDEMLSEQYRLGYDAGWDAADGRKEKK